ncbi:MAG TPA: TIR domain-containing protein [Candidatus Competibacteraceae bacterium]|nr:TIR domain-containing protein [Candidatus Competibacteraceae bacterium]HRZ05217.1 TIR domain-containing protein [Candidatus Competibacteraceae bacterium]HSA46576.1 TIR domain-containing protein [Candidatus Competibacteraceae bacterium]
MAAAPVFICHAFTENDFARDLGLALETSRLPVWRDSRQLRGSERLAPDVRWVIEQARQVIVVIGLNTGDQAWLRREIEMAQEAERRRADTYRVIPLLLPGVDPAILNRWFTPLPPTAPIGLTAEGLGAALPALLAALGAPPLFDADRSPSSLVELALTFGPMDAEPMGRRPLTARLNHGPESTPSTSAEAMVGPLPSPVPDRTLRWYWQDHPRWPIDTVRQFARHIDALLAKCGRALYQATLANPELQTLITDWMDFRERRLTIQADVADPNAVNLLALPWELLHDPTGFLVQSKQPIEFLRRLPGGGDPTLPAPVPLRLLMVNPRPDTEPTGHPDHRRSALPLFEALKSLGGLVEVRVLAPPTQTALEKELNEDWAAGRPFFALHLDGYLRSTTPADVPLFAFEADPDSPTAKYREAEFMPVPMLASLLATYRIRLVVLTGAGPAAAALAATLLATGTAAVITIHPNTPADALRRFWGAFHEELLRGARVSQAVLAGQRRLASDSYRAQGLGGGGVHLHDWFAVQLYLGHQDPRLALRPPLDLWRRLLNQSGAGSVGRLPEPPPTGFVGRGRNLLILERLLAHHTAIFIRGPGGCGKTATAAALATWLMRCGRYPHIAYLRDEDAGELRTLVESLGQQLLANGHHWTVASYPNLWQAVDHLWQTRHTQSTLIVLDQMEQWPAEHDEMFQLFWKKLLNEWPKLRLLGLGRLGPPAFAAPWREIVLGPLDDQDAITLMSRTLTVTGEIPPAADSSNSFQPLCELVTLVGGHPGAVRRLAHEIGDRGVSAALEHLRTIRSELLRRQGDDLQWPLYLEIELALNRLSASDRERLAILAFTKGGINRLALGHALELDNLTTDALCERLIALNLAEDEGYSHLRIDPALASYLNSRLSADQRAEWRKRWRVAMEQLLAFLYQQYFKDNVRTLRLLRLELPNLLALLRDCQQQSLPERTARLASQMEQLLAHLGVPAALAETVATRERAGQALPGWSRTRFETERLRIERLRDGESLEEAVQAARQLVRQCQEAGADAYTGAPYDQARTHFELGKLLKMANAAEPAVRELTAARQQFQTLVEAGNSSAARMAAVADAEIGDCLAYLRRLQDAATAYEAALAQADPGSPTGAANRLQLGLVYQRQGKYAAAATLYDAARRTFETLGQTEKTAQAWRQLSMAHKLDGQMERALQAGQKSLYLYEQQRNRRSVAEILGEVGHLHQVLDQLEEAVLAYRRMAELYAQLGDGRSEEASRNKLANVLIQLRRPDEARQELYRASECNLPESPTARNWTIRRGLRDVSQAVKNVEIADQARQQAIHKYLAYRRSGGENTNPGIRLCAQISQALRNGNPETISVLVAKLEQIATSPNVPPTGKLLIDKLRAILNGDRDTSLASDPNLHYQYAVELQLLLEELASNSR